RLQCSHFLAGGALEIHPEPEHRNEHSSDTSYDILRDLAPFFTSEFFHFDIVGFDFCHDHCTSRIGICDLNGCYGLWVATGAGNTRRGQCRDDERTHGNPNPLGRQMPPQDGFTVAYFLTVADIERSARFYETVFGGRILSRGDSSGAPGYIQIANTWLIVNVGGG